MKANKQKITKEQIYKMERQARRNVDIELQTPRCRNTVHKSAKQFTRKDKHKKRLDD